MINKYETMFIINQDFEEDAKKTLVEKVKALIETTGKVESMDIWGRRKLAYPINKVNEGFYVLANYETDSSNIAELERVLKITDGILKYLVIKKD